MNTLKNCQNCGQPMASDAPQGLCPACLMKIGLGMGTGSGPANDPSGSGSATAFVPPSLEQLQRLLPQFEVHAMIGRGGMGAVYTARQKSLDRLVALKILGKRPDKDPKFNERFAREARTLARLSHPHIISVFDFGEVEGLCYLVMEYVDGVNLRQMLQAQKIAPKEALAIVPDLCAALQYAHDQGIVHRDIKPENILIDRQGRVKIADFGLAKLVGTEAVPAFGVPPEGGPDRLKPGLQTRALTDAGKIMGTPHYMAPEQIEHPQAVDHRVDIYSLGVVFYEMLTGELPLGKFAPPSRKVQIDVRLDEVVLRTLEKEPERRYQQASHVQTAVETIASQSLPASEGSFRAHATSNPPGHSPDIGDAGIDSVAASAALLPEVQAVRATLRSVSLSLLVLGLAVYGTYFLPILAVNTLPPTGVKFMWQLFNPFYHSIPVALQILDFGNLGHLLGPLALVAAWQLRKCRGFGWANLAIALSFFKFDLLLWTIPLGVFGLRQLWRKEGRAAFAAVENQNRNQSVSRDEARENNRLAIASAGLALVSLLCLPLFVVGSVDIPEHLGLVSVAFYWVRWLPHLAQGAGIVLGTLAIMTMPRMGSQAKGLGWALLGTLFPLLVCLAGCGAANRWTHTPVTYPVFNPYAMEPHAEQYLWQASWAILEAILLAEWAVYRQARKLRHGDEKAIRRMLHGIRWTIGIMVVAYAVMGALKFYSMGPIHPANLAHVVLVAVAVGWLANRSLQRISSKSACVILRWVKWVSWGVGMLVLVFLVVYLLSVQYRRMLGYAQQQEAFDAVVQYLTKHTHAQAPSGSKAKAFTTQPVSGAIELTMVSEPTAGNVVCWFPDGTIRCVEKPPLSQAAEIRTGQRTLVFGLAGDGPKTSLANLHWECWVTVASVESPCRDGYAHLNDNDRRLKGLAITVPRDAQTARLRLGIPGQKWEDTDAVWLWTGDPRGLKKKSIRRGGEDWEFGFERLETEKGLKGLSVIFTSQIKRNAEARLIAVDAEGTLHEPIYSSGQQSGAYFPVLLGRTRNCSVSFAGLKAAQLKELRFQVRPFYWIEFRNISLRPGQLTQVEVRDLGAVGP